MGILGGCARPLNRIAAKEGRKSAARDRARGLTVEVNPFVCPTISTNRSTWTSSTKPEMLVSFLIVQCRFSVSLYISG